jgi:uncharacterized membrane protein YfcA
LLDCSRRRHWQIQALASVASSAYRFARSGEVDARTIWKKALASAIGAGIGSSLQLMDPDILVSIALATRLLIQQYQMVFRF